MTERRYEVKAAVNTIVNNVSTIQPALIPQESLVLLINVLENGTEAVRVVDRVTEAWSVHNCQAKFHAAFFNFYGRSIEFQRLFLFLCKGNYEISSLVALG